MLIFLFLEDVMTQLPMTYASAGVNYDPIDRFKRLCQSESLRTAGNAKRLGFADVTLSRGESAYEMQQFTTFYSSQNIAFVEEGLGTKELVAAKMRFLTNTSFYHDIAQCTLAMIVNDIATRAVPIVASMHLAVGTSDWFEDTLKCHNLAEGYADACMKARCVWGCGETPVLSGVIEKGAAMIGGSAIGVVQEIDRIGTPVISGVIEDGDQILILESSGIHANGITLARRIAEKLPEGYLTKMPDGRSYGETILDPTHIYVGFMDDCAQSKIPIHYAVNITGHGWRKFMRSTDALEYHIVNMPKRPPIFDFISEHGPVEKREMYANYNMGAGFALYVPHESATAMLQMHAKGGYPFNIVSAGYIKKGDGKQVVIEPEGITFTGDELQVR